MCLGPNGFTMCDGASVWILADRREGQVLVSLLENDNSAMCLTRKWCHSAESPVGLDQCKSCGAKHWTLEKDRRRGYYRLSEDKGKNCLVRARPGKGKFKKYKVSRRDLGLVYK